MATIINVPDFDQDNKVLRFYSAFYYILRSENIIAPPRLHVTECSQAAGGTQLIYTNYAYEDTNPEFAKVSLDIYNAYNELQRAAVLQSLWDQPETRSLYMYAYNQLHPMSDMFLGSGLNIVKAIFRSVNGLQQGAPESSSFFCQAIRAPSDATQELSPMPISLDADGLTATTASKHCFSTWPTLLLLMHMPKLRPFSMVRSLNSHSGGVTK